MTMRIKQKIFLACVAVSFVVLLGQNAILRAEKVVLENKICQSINGEKCRSIHMSPTMTREVKNSSKYCL